MEHSKNNYDGRRSGIQKENAGCWNLEYEPKTGEWKKNRAKIKKRQEEGNK